MIRISNYQLFCLIVLFEIGSSILFVRGIEAKQDAWLAVLIGMTGGFGLMWIYTQFQKIFPEKNLAEMIISILGKPLGMPLVFFYGLFFLYCSVKNFHEFGLLLNITFLPHTPIMIILGVFMFAALYIVFLGVEVLARGGYY
jgi:spore germination protein KB